MSNRVMVKLCDQCEEHWVPRAVVALSEDRKALVFLVPGAKDDAQWWSVCHWDYETDRMEPMYRILDKGQDAKEVLGWYEGELAKTRAALRSARDKVFAEMEAGDA